MGAEFRRGVRLAVDWGKARVGVAACDPDGLLAYPVETVPTGPGTVKRLTEICAEYDPIEVLLGWPVNLAGREGPAVRQMAEVADRLDAGLALPLRVVDERLSTASAARKLAASGKTSRSRRSIIDQAAAVDILEQALDYEKRTGRPAGCAWPQEG
ncbi:Holliday junction resolvase RuvX [Brooklawnia sp.]|uniref:Holliday junction resolvase RuvX n=1 Tax=Brooklawnia sp. TaxID=2699740 RepID=UPI00311F761E